MAQDHGPPDPLPTFCTMPLFCWDDERNAPEPVWVASMDHQTEEREWARDWISSVMTWLRVQDDPREADARRAYAEHVARYLVGIFPNARVNPDAYAAGAGEELGAFSGDIVKAVGQRARRTAKTLPSIAALLEWAEAEASRRTAQSAACIRAVAEFERQEQAGRERAEATVRALHERGRCMGLTAEALRIIYRRVAGIPLGIEDDSPRVRRARSLIAMLNGHEGAIAMLETWMRDHLPAWLAEHEATQRYWKAEASGDSDAAEAAWRVSCEAHTLTRPNTEAAEADLAALLGQRPVATPKAPSAPVGASTAAPW